MSDQKVKNVQNWLNNTYEGNSNWVEIDADGMTGRSTVKGLIRALQIELNLSNVDGIFGKSTIIAFDTLFPNKLSPESYSTKPNITKILTGGFYCRGIDPESFTDKFNSNVEEAVKVLQNQIGIAETGKVNGKLMSSVLTTDPYTLASDGDTNIRFIQQYLNNLYENYLSVYIPTTGIVERITMEGMIKGLQCEVGATIDGIWGNDTMSKLPVIPSSKSTKKLVYLLQFALYINGYNPNGFDGAFGNGVRKAVIESQKDYKLEADGYCGRKTWAALFVSCGDTTRNANACDTRFEITDALAQKLKSDGYNIVGRYIAGGNFKELREDELLKITKNGLKAFLIYQRYDRDIKVLGPIEGGRAAVNANGAVIKHSIPENSIVYFAIDLDVYESEIEEYVKKYFVGINKYKNGKYKVGIYAPRLVCQRIMDAGLAEYCFVSDMSYGYSCNIGNKIPKNWTLDQFKEISNYYYDSTNSYEKNIDIDKVMFSENAQLVTSISTENKEYSQVNAKLYEKLDTIYELAKQFRPDGTIALWNYLVNKYFMHIDYNEPSWNVLTGLFPEWIKYVNKNINENDDFCNQTYIYDRNYNYSIKYSHLASVLSSLMYNSTEVWKPYIMGDGVTEVKVLSDETDSINFSGVETEITDLCGWAGDLIQLMGKYTSDKTGQELINSIKNSIGSEGGKFDLEDFIQDIDAVNLFKNLKSKKISLALKEYYESDNNRRMYKFIENRKFIGFLPISVTESSSDKDILKALAYRYIGKDGILDGVMVNLFTIITEYDTLDSNRWKEPTSEAWATKIIELVQKGL